MHRSRRQLAGPVLGAMLLVLAHAAPATAATVVTTGVPSAWSVYNGTCGGVDGGTGSVTTVAGPASPAPPLGSGSLRIHQGAPQDIPGMFTSVDSLAGVSSFAFSIYDPAGATVAVVQVYADSSTWQGVMPVPADPGWISIDLLPQTFSWTDLSTMGPPTESATIDEFVAAHGDHPADLLLARTDCGNGTELANSYIDGLTFGVNGASSTYDFELGLQKPTVTMTVKDTTIRVGDDVIVTGKVTPALPGVRIFLKRRTADGVTKIGSGVIARNGSYKIVKELKAKGTYKLFTAVPATSTSKASKSTITTVTVR